MVSRWDSTPYWVIAAPGDNVYTIPLADASEPTGNIIDTGEIVFSEDYSNSTFSDSDSENENRVFIIKNVQNCQASNNDIEDTELILFNTHSKTETYNVQHCWKTLKSTSLTNVQHQNSNSNRRCARFSTVKWCCRKSRSFTRKFFGFNTQSSVSSV